MARWYGLSITETRALTMPEFFRYDRFTGRYPPADILIASFLKVKVGQREGTNRPASTRDVARDNTRALADLPRGGARLQSIHQLPAFVRGPEMQKVMEGVRAQWQTNSE